MAAARNAKDTKSIKNGRSASRLSFAKITDTLTVPDLLALQTESFDWLVGNEHWQKRVEQAKKEGRQDLPSRTGLEEIFEEISPIENLDETMQLSFTNFASLTRTKEVQALIESEIQRVNQKFAQVEQVKKFRLLETQLTAEDEELTPTLKLKRKNIYVNFSQEIEEMYQGGEA